MTGDEWSAVEEASRGPWIPVRLGDLLSMPDSIGVDELRTVLGLPEPGGVGAR